MQRRPLEITQKKSEKSLSQAIRQTSSGNKPLKVTNKGDHSKLVPTLKQKNEPLLKVSQSPKSKKNNPKPQIQTPNQKKLQNQQTSAKKQSTRKKIVSYISHQSEKQQDLKVSVVEIDLHNLDDAIDDDINMLSISNYPIKNNSDFLRETHLTSGQAKKQYMKADMKKHDELKKSSGKIRKTNSKKHKDSRSKQSGGKTKSEKKLLCGSNRKQQISKSHKKLQKSNNGLNVSLKPLQKSAKGCLSKTKKGKKQKSSSTQTNKGCSSKKPSKTGTQSKPQKKSIPKESSKSIPKPSKPKKKKSPERKNLHMVNMAKPEQQEESSSDTTKTPTLQELQKLRQQNEKYKIFLATSAFKVQDLKKQIQQHKQIRQNERGIYNFQLNNLKKQLDANKKSLGHLYSYDQPQTIPGFIPDHIIVETDNESSSMLESMNLVSKVSKHPTHDEALSEGSNNIRKSNQSHMNIGRSNPSSNSNEDDEKLTKTQLTAIIREMKDDLIKQQANLKFLSQIQKIPSLEVKISFEESDKSSNGKENELLSSSYRGLGERNNKDSVNNSYDESENALLLLNSVGK